MKTIDRILDFAPGFALLVVLGAVARMAYGLVVIVS